MSVLEEIKKLEEQKVQLLQTAKKQALAKANVAISELASLGFHYNLLETDTVAVSTGRGQRRTGIRDEVHENVAKAKDGITRADLLEQMGAKGDKSTEQSISNALSALKKAGTINLTDGLYSDR